MNDKQRALAEFYARLASIPNPNQLSRGEQLVVEEACGKLLSTYLRPALPTTAYEAKNRTPVGWNPEEHGVPIWLALDNVSHEQWGEVCSAMYTHAQEIIVPLLNGERVDWKGTYAWVLDKEKRIVREAWVVETDVSKFTPMTIASTVLADLIKLIRQDPFPFRQCPVCKNVFVPVRKQIYCSPNCTYTAIEEKRRDDPKRKAALADNQRERRARLKQETVKPKTRKQSSK